MPCIREDQLFSYLTRFPSTRIVLTYNTRDRCLERDGVLRDGGYPKPVEIRGSNDFCEITLGKSTYECERDADMVEEELEEALGKPVYCRPMGLEARIDGEIIRIPYYECEVVGAKAGRSGKYAWFKANLYMKKLKPKLLHKYIIIPTSGEPIEGKSYPMLKVVPRGEFYKLMKTATRKSIEGGLQ